MASGMKTVREFLLINWPAPFDMRYCTLNLVTEYLPHDNDLTFEGMENNLFR
jgi:hypothetical protein